MIEFAIYLPKRKAVFKHMRPTVSLGIGNMIDNNKYIPVMDIDKKINYKNLIEIIRGSWRVIGYCGYVLVSTRKGYHIIFETITNWKTLNRLWSKYKNVLDKKWIKLQRLRRFAILRVYGKYVENDICIIEEALFHDNEWFNKWYSLYKSLIGGRTGGRKCANGITRP